MSLGEALQSYIRRTYRLLLGDHLIEMCQDEICEGDPWILARMYIALIQKPVVRDGQLCFLDVRLPSLPTHHDFRCLLGYVGSR